MGRTDPLPRKVEHVFYTWKENQTEVEIELVEGESSEPKLTIPVGCFEVSGIPPCPMGTKVEVALQVPEVGVIHASAKVNDAENSLVVKQKDRIPKKTLDRLREKTRKRLGLTTGTSQARTNNEVEDTEGIHNGTAVHLVDGASNGAMAICAGDVSAGDTDTNGTGPGPGGNANGAHSASDAGSNTALEVTPGSSDASVGDNMLNAAGSSDEAARNAGDAGADDTITDGGSPDLRDANVGASKENDFNKENGPVAVEGTTSALETRATKRKVVRRKHGGSQLASRSTKKSKPRS